MHSGKVCFEEAEEDTELSEGETVTTFNVALTKRKDRNVRQIFYSPEEEKKIVGVYVYISRSLCS